MRTNQVVGSVFLCLVFAAGVSGCSSGSSSGDGDEEIDNTKPTAQDVAVSVDEDIAKTIQLSATNAEADELSYSILTEPENGSFVMVLSNIRLRITSQGGTLLPSK